jgi:hypothetical protein
MAVKHISDWQVCAAVHDMRQRQLAGEPKAQAVSVVIELLVSGTGQSPRVCLRALERAYRHGFLESGLWWHGGWLTDEGIRLLYLSGPAET